MSPQAGLAQGIDVSHFRGRIDWAAVKGDGISFGIPKATDGSSFIDPTFDYNWTQMRQVGLIRGAFHFFRPLVDPATQAGLFLQIVGDILHHTDLPPILDVEAYPQTVRDQYFSLPLSERLRRIRVWLETVEAATGRVPIIYTNRGTWLTALGNTLDFVHYPLWVANYEVTTPDVPADNWGGAGWTLWQYSSTGAVAGVNGGQPPTDLNVYKDNEAALQAWLGITGPRPLPPDVSNAQMLQAVYIAADTLGQNPQQLVNLLGFGYLSTPVSNRSRPYDGPAVVEMPLSGDQKLALLNALEQIIDDGDDNDLHDLTNQDVINGFYQAADLLGMPGWTLLQLAGLAGLVNDREAQYTGPSIDQMSGLNDQQKAALYQVFGIAPPDGEEPPDDDVPYPDLTNQGMINAFYIVARAQGVPGWTLLNRAGLTDLVNDRQALYTGPRVEDMDGLTQEEKVALADALGVEPPDDDNGDSGQVTYPGLVNQDMINIFYRAAAQLNQSGWAWIARAGLEDLAASQDARMQPYTGPRIEDMPGLNAEEKAALQAALDDLLNS